MRDQFYIVLPSNSSMQYFPENTTSHFVTKLPKEVQLHGDWTVALTEIQIPLTFLHLTNDVLERTVVVEMATTTQNFKTDEFVDITGLEFQSEEECFVNPGVYRNIDSLVEEINNLESVKSHLRLRIERGGFVKISRTCNSNQCTARLHKLELSEKIWKILGVVDNKRAYSNGKAYIMIKDDEPVTGERPANLAESLPNMLMVYGNLLEPYVTGDVQTRLLRAVSLDIHEYNFGLTKVKAFSPAMYLPLLFNSFQAVEIDIRDQMGQPLPFTHGTLTITLHFRRA